MAVEYGTDSNYAKEMRRHNAVHTVFGPPGRPYVYAEFPRRLYKAARVDGQIKIVEGFTVHDEDEQRNMQSRGFYLTQPDAIAVIEQEQTVHGTLAAEREWEIRHSRLSEQATMEIRAAEAAHGSRHLPEIPETPILAHRKKRGRPAKAALVEA